MIGWPQAPRTRVKRGRGVFYGYPGTFDICQHGGWRNLFLPTMWSSSVVTWLACSVLVFWAVGAYNRLVRLRSAAVQAFGAMDAQLLRHSEVVQALAPEPEASTLAPDGEGAASAATVLPEPPGAQERVALQAASKQFSASLAAARLRPLEREVMAALASAHSVLVMAWQNALAASGPFDSQMADSPPYRWEQWTTHSQTASAQFNDAVTQHNRAISQFPAWLLAKLFGFKMAGTL